MLYVLIIFTTITRFGTIGGAGVAVHSIEFNSAIDCGRAMDWVDDLPNTRAVCFPKGKTK